MRNTTLKLASFVLVALCLCLVFTCPARCADQDSTKFTRPQVLVLVLGGFGPSDQCSINYDSVVALPKAQSDLDTIGAAGKWQVSNAKGETKASGGPKSAATTSISFTAKGLIGYSDGTLPLEPYIIGLKRHKYIEVDYIAPSSFVFHGLEDFENDFVKIQLVQSGNSYRYRIVVKDPGFSKLDLPRRESEQPKTEESRGTGARRLMMAIGTAVLASLVAYLVVMYMSKRR